MHDSPILDPGRYQQTWRLLEVDILCLAETRLDALARYRSRLARLEHPGPGLLCGQTDRPFGPASQALEATGMA